MSQGSTAPQGQITVYGADWCPDVRRSRALLDGDSVSYAYVDVDQDETAADLVRDLQHGERRIPTIVLPDGSFLVEPSDDSLREALARIS